MKEKIRLIYAELQGYLAQIPDSVETNTWTQDNTLWNQFNLLIGELKAVSRTEYNYDRFKIIPETCRISPQSEPYLRMRYSTYKASLGGLIARLHAEYFSNEEPPFRTMPSTVINQTQTQTQSVNLLLDIQEKVISEIPKHKEGSKERNFLEKIKNALPSMKTGTDIISNILKIGSEIGLHASEIEKILHF
jgi:hypothetical protein